MNTAKLLLIIMSLVPNLVIAQADVDVIAHGSILKLNETLDFPYASRSIQFCSGQKRDLSFWKSVSDFFGMKSKQPEPTNCCSVSTLSAGEPNFLPQISSEATMSNTRNYEIYFHLFGKERNSSASDNQKSFWIKLTCQGELANKPITKKMLNDAFGSVISVEHNPVNQ